MTMRRRDPLTPAQEARFSWPDYPLTRCIERQERAARYAKQTAEKLNDIPAHVWSAEVRRLVALLQRDNALAAKQARDAYDLWRSTLRGQWVPSREPTQ